MIEILINDIEQAMLNTLNNEQLSQLRKVLEYTFRNVSVTENNDSTTVESNAELVKSFLSSKSVEGCSEKTIAYYRSTINNSLESIGKKISHVTTDDLRNYLNTYQQESNASKVTVDNIRSEYSDYLYLYFQSADFRDQISGGKSSTMNQITQKMLDKIEIPLPDQDVISSLSAILKQADKSKYYNQVA